MRRLSLSLILLSALAIAAAPAAHADTSDPAARSTARKLGQEALKLYDAGDYDGALDKFTTANQLVPTPTLGLYAARCLVKKGRLVEAGERYLEVSRMQLDRAAPAVMRKAVIDAVAERDKLLPTIPTLEVRLDGPQGDGVTVVVDGQPLLPGLIGEKRPVDPGHHQATAKRADVEVSQQADVQPSQAALLLLKLPPLPPPPLPPVPPTSPLRVASWIGLGVGAAGAIVAVVAGGIAVADENQLNASKSCYQYVCGPSEAGTISTFHTASKLTTAGMIVGVAGLGFGIPAFLLTSKKAPTDADGKPAHPSTDADKARVEPWVTLGGAGLRGTF
jgi:hypothetical protein